MKNSEELIKNTAIISIGKISTQVISFLLLPLYTSRLATEEYGNFDFVLTIASFIVPLVTMLMEESMFRFLIDAKTEDDKKKIISQSFLFSFGSGGAFSILAVFLLIFWKYELGYAILLYSVTMLFSALSNALSRGLGKIRLYSFSNFLSSLCIIVLNLIFILVFNWGFKALLISNVVSNIIASMFVLSKLRVRHYISVKGLNIKLMKEMIRYSIPLVPNTISWSIMNTSDRLVLMSFLGASANGLYSVAYKFPNLINTVYSFFNIAWRETSAKIVRDDDIQEFKKVYGVIKRGLFSITIVLIGAIKVIYPFFINANYSASVVYVPILAISVYYLSLSAFYGGLFTAYKNTNILGTTSLIAAGINLIVDLLLVKFIGIYAAAISTFVAAYFLYWFRKLKMKIYIDVTSKFDYLIAIVFALLIGAFYMPQRYISITTFLTTSVIAIIINLNIMKKMIKIVIRKKKN